MESKLPKGWKQKRLDEVATIIRGLTYKPSDVTTQLEGIACFRTKNIQAELDDSDLVCISKELVKKTEKLIQHGDLLISSANSLELLGKCCLIENLKYPATLGGFICCARTKPEVINYKYFYYFFSSEGYQKTIRSFANKTTGIANLPISKVEETLVPLPPLSEQQRIVAKLDKLFARIDKAIALVEENIKNAEHLMASVLNEVFEVALAKYSTLTIEKLFSVKSGDAMTSKMMNNEGRIPVYGGNGINGRTDKYNRSGSNIIIGRVGAKCGNIHRAEGEIWVSDNAFFICEFYQEMDFAYLIWALKFLNLGKTANQAAQPVISYKSIKNLGLPYPSVGLQKRIAGYIDKVNNDHGRLLDSLGQRLIELKQLKSSLLDSAFKGEL